MMLFEDADGLLRDLSSAISRIFALEGVILYVSDYDRFFSRPAAFQPACSSTCRQWRTGSILLRAD
ncbi:MAG: hypothetical protein WDM87_12725 [Terracidiphilus sp.]